MLVSEKIIGTLLKLWFEYKWIIHTGKKFIKETKDYMEKCPRSSIKDKKSAAIISKEAFTKCYLSGYRYI